MKHAILILVALFTNVEVNAQTQGDRQDGVYQQPNPPLHNYEPQKGRWAQPSYRNRYNYFKASMGFASIDDYSDSSGSIVYDSSAVMPINLAYGASNGNLAFEGELGFSSYDYSFNPVFGSMDPFFDGDLSASKLMFNGMFKTSQTGSNLYVGAGIGFVSVSMEGLYDELVGSSWATQFIIGGEMRNTERSSLFVEYKQFSSRGLELENAFADIEFDFEEASLNIGMKLYF